LSFQLESTELLKSEDLARFPPVIVRSAIFVARALSTLSLVRGQRIESGSKSAESGSEILGVQSLAWVAAMPIAESSAPDGPPPFILVTSLASTRGSHE
jgi:hypothetical protein